MINGVLCPNLTRKKIKLEEEGCQVYYTKTKFFVMRCCLLNYYYELRQFSKRKNSLINCLDTVHKRFGFFKILLFWWEFSKR
jgi:hypothetical protein